MDRLDAVAAIADDAFEVADPWSGLVSFMERMAELMAGDLGLRQMLIFATYGRDLVAIARQRNAPLGERLAPRGPAARPRRAAVRPPRLPVLVFTLTHGNP